MPIDVKRAVSLASEYVSNLYSDDTLKITLEEVQFVEEVGEWWITLGLVNEVPSPLGVAFGVHRSEPKYKVVALKGHNGQFISMKIREV